MKWMPQHVKIVFKKTERARWHASTLRTNSSLDSLLSNFNLSDLCGQTFFLGLHLYFCEKESNFAD